MTYKYFYRKIKRTAKITSVFIILETSVSFGPSLIYVDYGTVDATGTLQIGMATHSCKY